MKDFIFKNKFIILLFFIVCIIEAIIFSSCFGMENYEVVDFDLGIVNTDYLNLRTGPGKEHDWYIVQTDNNKIGTVHTDYIIKAENHKAPASNIEVVEETSNLAITTEEDLILSLINNEMENQRHEVTCSLKCNSSY